MLTYNSVRFLLLDPMEKGTKHSVVWYLKYKLTFVSRFMFIFFVLIVNYVCFSMFFFHFPSLNLLFALLRTF